ncbi:MAG TPA: zf-HC2 domain-containing protein, partial [Ktedonobacterales bacterium]|nr:zf-HC2 domain-containing protein [Ktedonobacterales bacterium]
MTPDAEHFHEQPEIIEERLSAYLDDMLDAEERTRLEAHIARCERCQQQLAELRRVRALMHALPQPALPRSFLLPVVVAPAPATSASPASPVRLRSTLRRQQAARMARAAQWLGTIAALLGLALLVSTAVLGTRGGTEATPSAAPAA